MLNKLEESLSPSSQIIEKCIALPIFVKTDKEDMFNNAKKIKILINEVIQNNE
tara:strand:- start:313 stop:471 length:159 start_codon:yes stop_codon:yes gene_type:complete